MSEKAWDWREHWADKTAGGDPVVAVYPNPNRRYIAIVMHNGRFHPVEVGQLGRSITEPDPIDLVPIVKEPEWEPWEPEEVPLDWWYRENGKGSWERIETLCYGGIMTRFRMSYKGDWATTKDLFDHWACTADPRPKNPVVQRCGKLKAAHP